MFEYSKHKVRQISEYHEGKQLRITFSRYYFLASFPGQTEKREKQYCPAYI